MGDYSSEPSMEEILSSIKKIIAEDSGKPIVLPKKHAASSRRSEPEETAQVKNNDVMTDSAKTEETVLELTEDHHEPLALTSEEIVSKSTEQVSRSALVSLSKMVVKTDPANPDTLEGLVRDMLRPMMKEWLDAHLPEVVERVVAQEVARISGRL
jgi:uncharacterized protein